MERRKTPFERVVFKISRPKEGGGGGGGLNIFTDRDQQSIFVGFEFRKSVFWGYLP